MSNINNLFKGRLLRSINRGEEFVDFLKFHNAYIVGGACTSILTNAPINDFDIYFTDEESFLSALSDYIEGDFIDADLKASLYPVGITNKSVTFKSGDVLIQFVKTVTGTPEEIFSAFDFTINMVAYNVRENTIVAHPSALVDLAQRSLRIAGSTRFPISTMSRIEKYISRGYSISTKEYMKLGILINQLEINSYEELIEHLGSMYGLSTSDLFDETIPFSLDSAFEQIDKLTYDLKNHTSEVKTCSREDLESKLEEWYIEADIDYYDTDYFERRLLEYTENNGWSEDE